MMQDWTRDDVYNHTLAAKDGYSIGYETAKAEYSAQLAAVTKQRDDFRRALEERVCELDELREQLNFADIMDSEERKHMKRMLEHAKRISAERHEDQS
jgi:hypothetical protein